MPMNTEVIECPVRGILVPVLDCHSCSNCMRVLFRSEYPPEFQCMVWRRWLDLASGEEKARGRVRKGLELDRPTGQDGPASLDATWPWQAPPGERT